MPERRRRKQLSPSLCLQLLISIAYSAMLVHMTVILMDSRTEGWFIQIMVYLPQLAIIVSSLVLLFILRLRHRTHSVDSTLLPALFTFIALESTMIMPLYSEITGITLLAPNAVVVLERFAMLSAAMIFVFSAVQYYGTNASRLRLYISATIGAAAFIALAMPLNTGTTDLTSLMVFSSSYDAMLLIALICIYLVSIATYIAAVAKDRSTHSISRASAFILMMVGNFFSGSNEPLPSVIGGAVYIIGIIMLSFSSKNTF